MGVGGYSPPWGHKKSDTTEVTKHSTHSIAEFSRRDRTLGSKIMQTGSWRRKVPKTQAWNPPPTALTQTSSVSFQATLLMQTRFYPTATPSASAPASPGVCTRAILHPGNARPFSLAVSDLPG